MHDSWLRGRKEGFLGMKDDALVEFDGLWQEVLGILMNGEYSVHQDPVKARKQDHLRMNLENHKSLDR